MHILVTGGAGFIGSHLVKYHIEKGDFVHVIDDLSTGTPENFKECENHPNFSFTQADILTYHDLNNAVAQADRIYHMAAIVGVLRVIEASERLLAINIVGTERLLRAAVLAPKKPRILLASTSEVYGECHSIPFKETENLVVGQGKKSCASYAVSKIALEYFGLAYHEHFGLPITILRIFNTIGPGQLQHYGMVVPRFIDYALNERPILVHGTGEQARSFCDVRDSVVMMDLIANTPQTIGQVLNLGQDQEISINDLALLIKKLTHSQSEIQHIPYAAVYGDGFTDIMMRRPDLSKLHQLIPFNYQWNLQKTLKDLIKLQRVDN